MGNPQQAEENKRKVAEAMAFQQQVSQGSALEKREDIDYTTSEGNHYKGTVVFKKPSAMDMMKLGGLKSEYLRRGGATDLRLVDVPVRQLAQVMATLSVVLVKRPEWLADVTEVSDLDILYHVYDKFDEWERQFRRTVQPTAADASAPAEGEKTVDAT